MNPCRCQHHDVGQLELSSPAKNRSFPGNSRIQLDMLKRSQESTENVSINVTRCSRYDLYASHKADDALSISVKFSGDCGNTVS